MFDKLVIKNFQSHNDTVIDFHKGVNVITGTGRHGKSAIIRAINLIVNNEPNDTGFINYNSDTCEVYLHVDNHIIGRIKGIKGKNLYTLDGKELSPGGKGKVPDEIFDILNMNDINIQMQKDMFFLINESNKGKVATRINEIVHLDIIDKTRKNIDSMVRESNGKVKNTKELISSYEEQLKEKKFKDLTKCKRYLEKYDGILSKEEDTQKHIDKMQKNIRDHEEYSKQNEWKPVGKHLDKYNTLMLKYDNTYEKIEKYKKNIREHDNILGDMQKHKLWLDTSNIFVEYKEIKDDYMELNESILSYRNIITSANNLNSSLVIKRKELENITKDIEENRGIICDICGGTGYV